MQKKQLSISDLNGKTQSNSFIDIQLAPPPIPSTALETIFLIKNLHSFQITDTMRIQFWQINSALTWASAGQMADQWMADFKEKNSNISGASEMIIYFYKKTNS